MGVFSGDVTRVAASALQFFVPVPAVVLSQKGELMYPLAVDLCGLNYVVVYNGP